MEYPKLTAWEVRSLKNAWSVPRVDPPQHIQLINMGKVQLQRLHQAFTKVITFLAEHQITFYAAYGTLVGLLRYGDLLHYDDDIDFIVSHVDMSRLRTLPWGEIGFVFVKPDKPGREHGSNPPAAVYPVKTRWTKWPRIEFFNESRLNLPKATGIERRLFNIHPFPLRPVLVPIPINGAKQLDAEYGPDWMQHIKYIRSHLPSRDKLTMPWSKLWDAVFDARTGYLDRRLTKKLHPELEESQPVEQDDEEEAQAEAEEMPQPGEWMEASERLSRVDAPENIESA